MSNKILFNNDWEFTKRELGQEKEVMHTEHFIWKKVDVPHDWLIYDTAFFDKDCEGWYRKYFFLDSLEEAASKDYLLRFEGIYMDSTIYVNGSRVGEWKYGYTTFECDITSALKQGRNEILVHVVLKMPNSRWYTGAGIYRNVWLKVVPRLHFASDGIYISTVKEGNEWKVMMEAEVISEAAKEQQYEIKHTIFNSRGMAVASSSGDSAQVITVISPHIWDIENPELYILKTELLFQDDILDEELNRFGFRTIDFNAKSGFYLNGRNVKLHGVCLHHDLGALGAAVNRCAIKRQLTLLKEMGANAIRTAHNMCAMELLELADEMGFLVANEAFDMWERPKNQYDYARFFTEWVERDVRNWIRRDRNHPCNIMWMIGNEIYDTHAGERGQELTRYLMELVYLHDPHHNAPVTIGSNYMPWENAQKCADIVKLAGYNYGEKYYGLHHKQHEDWYIYGSETSSVVQSRGIYHFPLAAGILCDDDEQCSSLGNSITSWGARSIEKCITDDRDAAFSAGMFIWSGFDYIGEPTPYHTKNSYFGQLDTAGFKKDSYYIYQAEWTDYKKAPMIHLFPYWDFNLGQLIDVRVCSNAPKVELFFNDISQGIHEIDHLRGYKLLGDWQIPYRTGELHAVAYDENNRVVAQEIQRSFSDAAKIIVKPDKTTMLADGQDLIFVEISMEDEGGNPVANANNRVQVKVTGCGRLIGLDNGDSTDYEAYKGSSRRLFSGKLLAILAATTKHGEISLEVSSPGFGAVKTTFQSKEDVPLQGISATEQNEESPWKPEIPIRKLEIISTKGTNLNDTMREVELEALVHPYNATYQEVTWRVTNASGVDSNLATLQPNGKNAILRAIGDGVVYVRAMAKNGGTKPKLISTIEFHINGLGVAFLNPYELVSGSLYSRSRGEISNGNERGVATARDGESILIYDKLDFGVIGSKEITVSIFELDSKPARIEIWEGDPGEEGSELLAEPVYYKKSIWNTYQEETFQLKRHLKGITSLAFLLHSKMHIKGFWFKETEKAYEQLSILAYSSLYGDEYRIGSEEITNIGNNVTISFDKMDFGADGCKKLTICGRCLINNSILVCFKGKNAESRQLIEFTTSREFAHREFEIDRIAGMQTVEFLFLPGCKFDFKWFKFE